MTTFFNIVVVHTMWTNLLPFRSGELSYLYLLKKKGGYDSFLTGVPSLFLARVFDLIALAILFLFSFVGLHTFPNIFVNLSYILLFLIVMILSSALFLVWKREFFLGRAKHYIVKFKLDRFRLIEKTMGKSELLLEGFGIVKNKNVLFRVTLCSLMVWLFIHLYTYVVINAVGIDFSLWQVFFISTLVVFLSLLPIHGWAGFGTTEGVWVLIAMAFGVTKETSIITGFQLHAIALLFVIILGALGTIFLYRVGTRSFLSGDS